MELRDGIAQSPVQVRAYEWAIVRNWYANDAFDLLIELRANFHASNFDNFSREKRFSNGTQAHKHPASISIRNESNRKTFHSMGDG